MNVEFTDQADIWYRLAERKAAQYFATLYDHVMDKSYVPVLIEDIQLWKRNHIHRHSWLSYFSRGTRKPDPADDQKYIQWLHHAGKLDDYLDRSVSYMYMRDLGKVLDTPESRSGIQRVVASIKNDLIHSNTSNSGAHSEWMSLAGVYRKAQKQGIEVDTIWVINKLRSVSLHIPKEMNAEQAQRKLIKIIIGVILHVEEELPEEVSPEDRAQKLGEAIRLGYSYGLAYPFIDDLLDSGVLSAQEKEQFTLMIRTALLTGAVPKLGEWTGTNPEMIHFIHSELRAAFECIKNHQQPETQGAFFEQAFVFFHSQEIDRVKDLSNANYSNEELYVPVILKSASSRLIARSVISAPVDEGFDHRTFFFGIYNQLADDFADMFEDMNNGAVTPYTYYLKYKEQRPDLINPYELYWTVIFYLIHNVYHSEARAREVILDRAINGLKRCKKRVGTEKYNEIMGLFASGNPELNRLVQQMVRKANDVDFFDKLLRDRMMVTLANQRKEKEAFFTTIQTVRDQINDILPISKSNELSAIKEPLIDAANYSLEGGGKRIRPILTWVMGIHAYGLQASAIVPLLRSLEYMHTASLIFDDLPSQDNASTRRGRTTLHELHNAATAELTGLFLIQKAIEEQASLQDFDPETVLALIKYSARKTEDMCMGQAMDLDSKGKPLTLEQLNTICFYKTGIAFEASLVMPAILAKAKEQEVESLKRFAYHAGIAFQIKDDLLDREGDLQSLGKPAHQDVVNNTSTFVTILGVQGAEKEMWEHYCLAMETLNEMPRHHAFLKHLLNSMVNRDR